jgi:hypothetical protein
MLTTIALLATLVATPDAGPAPISPEGLREANAELDAIAVIAVMEAPLQRQAILSAILCDAQERYRAVNAEFAGGRFSRALVLAEQAALRDEAGARWELDARGETPHACTEWSVSRLVTCLDAAAPFWCATDARLAAPLRAAEDLIKSWKPRPVEPSSKPSPFSETPDGEAKL